MNKYGRAAIRSVELYKSGLVKTPQDAWSRATGELFGIGTASQKKSCPKGAFLGLCEEGLIKDVPRGSYTYSKENKKYALDAVAFLKRNPDSRLTPAGLWDEVMKGESKVHNNQMDVVISLWNKGLIV